MAQPIDRRGFLTAATGMVAGAAMRGRARMQTGAYTLDTDPLGKALKDGNGRTVFVYMTKRPDNPNFWANSTCCFHPLFTPSGERITDFAPGDHHHHRGVFLAWHSMTFHRKADFSKLGPLGPTHGSDINRADFWGWGQFAPIDKRVITNRDIRLVKADARSAELEIVNDWNIEDQRYLAERTTVGWHEEKGGHVLDLTYQLTPDWDLTLDRTAFGGFCVRARNDGESGYWDPSGKVSRPDPHYSAPDLNWPDRDWYAVLNHAAQRQADRLRRRESRVQPADDLAQSPVRLDGQPDDRGRTPCGDPAGPDARPEVSGHRLRRRAAGRAHQSAEQRLAKELTQTIG